MASQESVLKVDCARLGEERNNLEAEINSAQQELANFPDFMQAKERALIAKEKAAFDRKQEQRISIVKSRCNACRVDAESLIDSFPNVMTKEFAGKCEVKTLEKQLENIYPQVFLNEYVCNDPIEFESDSDAYTTYLNAERKVMNLKDRNLSSKLFNLVTGTLGKICSDEGSAGKIGIAAMAAFMGTIVFAPQLFLGSLVCCSLASLVHGSRMNNIMRDIYSVKSFLNSAYDEDIFRENKDDLMENVDSFLSKVVNSYTEDIMSAEFKMDEKQLEDLRRNLESKQESLTAEINMLKQKLDTVSSELTCKLNELDLLMKEREEQAAKIKETLFKDISWKHEWLQNIVTDITSENRVLGCDWTQSNTLYVSKKLSILQQFQKLAILQSMMKMHPSFANQVVIDFKYMGGKVVRFSACPKAIIEFCTEEEAIEKRVDRAVTDMRARYNTVLQGSASLAEFNALMATYDSPGEYYTVFHLVGLSSLNDTLINLFRNGPRVGFFFKLYLTFDELSELKKDFPFSEFSEFAEISTTVVPRTETQIRRLTGTTS